MLSGISKLKILVDKEMFFLKFEKSILELKELLEDGRIKNSFIDRFSNYLYLKPLLDEHSSPLGKEIKLNI